MNRWIALSALVAILASTRTFSDETHSHPAPERLGTVTFETSCKRTVAHAFERAVALLHSFAYEAAEKAFEQVAADDPNCAMAFWGVALSRYHPLWSAPDEQDLNTGRAAIARARQLGARSERERLLISAASDFYRDSEQLSHEVRANAYAGAMAGVAQRYPRDTEVQVFYALALVATAPADDRTHANQKRAGSILEPIYRANPDHPGVAHYLIHTYDSAELAPRALAAARAYSKIAPSVPHALHMPSHIFTRLGLWDESIASNSAARAAARSQGDTGEELHAMDYLAYAYLQRGRDADAQRIVADLVAMGALAGDDFKIGYAATAMPVRLSMERQRWSEAASLQPLPDSPPHVAAVIYWARAEANARSGHPSAADADVARLVDCRDRLGAAGVLYWKTQVEVLGLEAQAWQAAAERRSDEAVRLLRQAADLEDGVDKLPVTPGPIIPAREQLGELLLQLGRVQDALTAYQASLVQAPGRRGSLNGALQAAEKLGHTDLARALRAQL